MKPVIGISAAVVWTLLVFAIAWGIKSIDTPSKPYVPLIKTEEQKLQVVLETRYHITYPTSHILANTIIEASKQEHVSVSLLVAIIQHESHFKWGSVSTKGARGYMQVRYVWDDICPYDRNGQYDNIFQGACALKHSILQGGTDEAGLQIYNIGIGNYSKRVYLGSGRTYSQAVLKEQQQVERLL